MKDTKQAASEVRIVLKALWPYCRFSVRSRHFAGGSAVDIRWTDGPTERQVNEATADLKGYVNGYYNEYIGISRKTSREVMVAAAKAAADYYEVAVPKVVVGVSPHVDHGEALRYKIHRAVWLTSVYGIELDTAFAEAYPIN